MRLASLVYIIDGGLTISLVKKIDGTFRRYNFTENKWGKDTNITNDTLITVDGFLRSGAKDKCIKDDLLTWSTLDCNKLTKKEFTIIPKRNIIVNITIEFKNDRFKRRN